MADTEPGRQRLANRWRARVAVPGQLLTSDADILVPAALGATLTPQAVPVLRCRAIVGPANNQLADDSSRACSTHTASPWHLTRCDAGDIVASVAREISHIAEPEVQNLLAAIGGARRPPRRVRPQRPAAPDGSPATPPPATRLIDTEFPHALARRDLAATPLPVMRPDEVVSAALAALRLGEVTASRPSRPGNDRHHQPGQQALALTAAGSPLSSRYQRTLKTISGPEQPPGHARRPAPDRAPRKIVQAWSPPRPASMSGP